MVRIYVLGALAQLLDIQSINAILRSCIALFCAFTHRMASEKPVGDRVKECAAILNDITALGIPSLSPEVSKLRGHMNDYIREGTPWSGTIDFSAYGRIAEVVLPRRADKAVEVVLRLPRAKR